MRYVSSHPILFEALIFLKYNRHYWNKQLIIEAYNIIKHSLSKRVQARISEDDETHTILDNDL